MNFYFALYQLIETVQHLSGDIQHLAGRALRISPRDARANRELLEQCESKLSEVRHLLNNKTHISKITLRKAALLFQILEISYRRVTHLAASAASVGSDDEATMKTLWQFLAEAQKHHHILVNTLNEMTGIPVSLNLRTEADNPSHGLVDVLKEEMAYQQETLKHLERAIEVFGEEQELADTLAGIRRDLLEARKRTKHLVPAPMPVAVEKVEITAGVSFAKS